MTPLPDLDLDPLSALPVFIYARLSKNPDGSLESVKVQLHYARLYAAKMWPDRPVIEFTDDGITAAGEELADRPGFAAMVAAIRLRRGGVVLAKNQKRVVRNKLVWEQFKIACVRAGIPVLHTYLNGGGTVPLTDTKSLQGDIMVLIDSAQVAEIKAGVRDTLDKRRAEGKPTGNCFGYTWAEGARVPDPDTATVVPRMYRMLLAGNSLSAIREWLNTEKVSTLYGPGVSAKGRVRSGAWSVEAVRSVLTNPSVTALVCHKGHILGDGDWTPLVDRDTWEAVQARLGQPGEYVDGRGVTRRRPGPGTRTRAARAYFLSGGIARCGRPGCGAALSAQRRTGGRQPIYNCRKARGGCGRLSVLAADLEALVEQRVFTFLRRPDILDVLGAEDDNMARRVELRTRQQALSAKRSQLGVLFARDTITSDELEAGAADLSAQEAEVADELARIPAPMGEVNHLALPLSWDALSVDARRTALAGIRCQVIVAPATPGVGTFEEGRVTVTVMGWAAA